MNDNRIQIQVDPTNPGQFLACCGLFELADRLWNGAHGWFCENGRVFTFQPTEMKVKADAGELLRSVADSQLTNTMMDWELARLDALSSQPKRSLDAVQRAELDTLLKYRRERPLVLHGPFNLQIDWFLDSRSGGSRFKTWAGQQSVLAIAQAMKEPIDAGMWRDVPAREWLALPAGSGVPFNFDSDLGGQSAALDVGFSLDPLGLSTRTRALIEFAAFIGLERFRPRPTEPSANAFYYSAWTRPLLPSVASLAATGLLPTAGAPLFRFSLLYRTKYLKSFLPATLVGR